MAAEYGETTHYQDVNMEDQVNEESSQNNYVDTPYLGPSTSGFSSFDILDLEAASKNHINDVNEKDIEEETHNIMEDVSCEEQQKKDDRGIVLQIIKEKGNLKSKQVSKFKQSKEESLRNKNIICDIKLLKTEGEVDSCSECLSYFNSGNEDMEYICICGKIDLFKCEKCGTHFEALDGLLQHIKIEHKDIQIPREYETLLNKQLFAIEKVKNTAQELMNLSKFSAVRTLLETSKKSLDSFKMDVFGNGDTNVFRMYVMSVYKEIYKVLNKHKVKENGGKILRKSKKKSNGSMEHENLSKNLKRNKKDSSKKSVKKIKKTNTEFSSEDELCLKDSVLKLQEAKVLEDGEIVGRLDEECEELCLQFYAVPYKASGQSISLYEMECLSVAVRNMWDGARVDLAAFADIMIKRFEREVDEVLPEDALFAGYVAKENVSIFMQPKKFSDIFDENFLLNDGIKPHKIKKNSKKSDEYMEENGESMDRENSFIEIDIENSVNIDKQHLYKNDAFSETTRTISESDDSQDDGFEEATKFLTHIPGDKKQKNVVVYGKCDICRDEYGKKRELIQHMNDRHMALWRCYTCKVCGIRMLPRERLWKHFKLHANKIIQECELCCETFLTTHDKEAHIHNEHRNDLPICPLCKSQFEHLSGLQEHFDNEHNITNKGAQYQGIILMDQPSSRGTAAECADATTRPECSICHRTFTSVGRLSQHLTTMHQDKKSKKKK